MGSNPICATKVITKLPKGDLLSRRLLYIFIALFTVLGFGGIVAMTAGASTSACLSKGPTCGDNVNPYGNVWTVASGTPAAELRVNDGSPSTSLSTQDFIRTGTNPYRYEYAPNGVASGYCASDPGGGDPNDPTPDGIITRVCNTGNFQLFKTGVAGYSKTTLVNVATGLKVGSDNVGLQLIGRSTVNEGAYWGWSGGTTGSGSYNVTAWLSTYTWWNNSPPGCGIEYGSDYGYHTTYANCASNSVNNAVGALGTYANPITFAAQNSGVFNLTPGTKIYIPVFKKYFELDDLCATCYTDQAQADLWVGGVSQTQENDPTPSNIVNLWEQQTITVNPASNLPVDTTPFYQVTSP